MKKISALVLVLLFSVSLSAIEKKQFSGQLDSKGSVTKDYKIDTSKVFFVQAFIILKKNWRSIPVFINEKGVWIDMGPTYRKNKFIINIFVP